MIDDLRTRWDLLILDIGAVGSAADGAIGDLLSRHAEPHRSYHSIEHLVEVHAALDELAAAGEHAADSPPVRFAAWFHDAIYDPMSADNEARSADLAIAVLGRIGVDAETRDAVAALIELTASHQPTDGNEAAAVLSDADLAILAAAPERYVRYRRQVRAEYAHLDDAQWRRGRTRVLDSFLGRPHLFWTVEGRLRWEDSSRANLRAEREILSRDP